MTADWTAPTADEVAPGVYRIPLPLPSDGLRAVNVYALLSPEGLALVDSGWAIDEGRAELERALRSIGFALGDIQRFLVTHVHRDHYTLGIRLRDEFGSRVALGAGERPNLEEIVDPAHVPFATQLAALRRCGADRLAAEIEAAYDHAHPDRSVWQLPDEWLRDGDRIAHGPRSLDVVSTPGHTPGHVVFYDSAGGLLFAGDHVLPTITPSIGLGAVMADNPLGDFLHSLAIVRSRPDALLLPAHGPVAPSAHTRVDQLAEHHARRLDQTHSAIVEDGAHTAFEAAVLLKWTKRERDFDELDQFNSMLAVMETEAHLVLLTAQGRLNQLDRDGVIVYASL